MSAPTRWISHSEASSLLDCQVKHAFAYTGTLTDGDALEPKTTAPLLVQGKLWGRAVAEWHETGSIDAALDALAEAALGDERDDAADAETVDYIADLLRHYAGTTDRLPGYTDQEREIKVPIPGLPGYGLEARLDATCTDSHGVWIVEHKLRKQLTPLAVLELDRQPRWYAWAYREETGEAPAGVIVDERYNGLPTARARRDVWQQRHRIIYREAELDEVGDQLITVAQMIWHLERDWYPVRRPDKSRCLGCDFRAVCGDPDPGVIDALYDRVPAKRDREVVA